VQRGGDLVEAARQLVAALGSGTTGSVRRFRRALRQAIRQAKAGDPQVLRRFVRRLVRADAAAPSRLERPSYQDEPEVAEAAGEGRQAGVLAEQFEAAKRYVTRWADQEGMSPSQVRGEGQFRGALYDAWAASQDQMDPEDRAVTWAAATDAVAHEIEQMTPDEMGLGPESGMTGDKVYAGRGGRSRFWATAGPLNVPRTAGSLLKLAGQMVDHYAATTHPQDLTDRQIKSFLHRTAPDVPFGRMRKTLDRWIQRKIPRRYED
jgi:hypothetical protein